MLWSLFMCIVYIALVTVAAGYIFGVPVAIRAYGKAAIASVSKRGWKKKVQSEDFKLSSTITNEFEWTPDAGNLAAYSKVLGVQAKCIEKFGEIPVLYPQTQMFMSLIERLCEADYPFPLLGMVHVSNFVRQERALRVDETFTSKFKVCEAVRNSKRGTIVEYQSHLVDAEGLIPWTSTMTVLHVHRNPLTPDDVKNAIEVPVEGDDVVEKPFLLAESAGRKYAAVSGDYNPIHMHGMLAKLMGFRKAIAHGLYTIGTVNAEIMNTTPAKFPIVTQAYFKRPAFLPSKNVVRTQVRTDGTAFSVNSSEGICLVEGEIMHAK
ncbi:hypothetical protein SARC_02168 [Sphaeroforma arctica JP610]|uniref:MaoC-like domain-containing protein n=1 Tax=Sphaeroforma arctica JP610 TaxID=667725 RepID=A0A0L0G9F4_9EUKA|nr:hypothetical protein SARC_02168 [Sphaeroforma arctica JP610]KNC85647.1 hypothetical protein SARC_02168 [Sphaeroforma arctica JP610]|eukprot:XP_014159549.1 hypothetical protein SARC_02168 [Sphaeroforma arctica JP610]